MADSGTTNPALYAIINDCDCPEPRMVCQWVTGVGYCYLERKFNKPGFDGMNGSEATSMQEFGFDWTENSNGTVSFSRSERAVTALYRDGEPRRWQHQADQFDFPYLTRTMVSKKKKA